MADGVDARLDLLEQPLALQLGGDGLAGREPLHAGVGAGRIAERSVFVEDVDDGEAVPFADGEVVGVVSGRYLERAGAKLGGDGLVGDDGNEAPQHRQADALADRAGVSRVAGVDRDGDVAEQRFGARRGDREVAGAVLVGVANVVEAALLLRVLHLQVGEGGAATDAPVDDALAAVDQPFVVEVFERRSDGADGPRIERERLALPVARRAEPAVLVVYRVAGLADPLPHALEERLATDVVARRLLGGELALDDDLRGDAGVVGSGEVERGVALHSAMADERVLDGGGHCVAEVQFARHVGGRHNDGEGPLVRVGDRPKVAGALPPLVEPALDLGVVVGFGKGLAGRVGGHRENSGRRECKANDTNRESGARARGRREGSRLRGRGADAQE